MLRELKNIRQIDGERQRRWFADDEMDLILWFSPEKRLDGFEICYDKLGGTRTITWKNIRTRDGTMKSVLMAENAFERKRIKDMLAERSGNLEQNLRQFILDRLETNGGGI